MNPRRKPCNARPILLALAVPLFADSYFPFVVARHRPMHPDDAQPVTFAATATADRVMLAHERFDLGTAPDGSHVYTSAEPETVKSAILEARSRRACTSTRCPQRSAALACR